MSLENPRRIFPGNSQMAQRMRAFDWTKSALGLPENWPEALKTSVHIILTSRHAMFIWWGDNFVTLYNDEYESSIHSKTLDTLGKSASAVWPEIWHDIIVPRIEFAKYQDRDTFDKTRCFINFPPKYPEMTSATFSFSLILNDEGEFGGVIFFDDNYRDFMNLTSSGASSAIQNAGVYSTEKRHQFTQSKLPNEAEILRASKKKLAIELAEARQLQCISSRMIEENNIESLCEQILDTAMAIMNAEFSSIQILDTDCDELRLLAWRNFHPESAKYWQTVSVKTGTSCGAALQHGERIIVPDVNGADFLQNTESLRQYRLSSIASVQSTPLITRAGQVLGMISTHWRECHAPNEYELALFDVLARQMADVLERQRAQEKLKEADRRKDEFLAVLPTSS